MNSQIVQRQLLLILAIYMFASCSSRSQEIKVEQLPFKTYDFKVSLNSSPAEPATIPEHLRSSPGILTDVANYYSLDTIIAVKKALDEYRAKNNVDDEGNRSTRYGLIKDGNSYSLRKLDLEVKYLYREIGGGYRIDRIHRVLNAQFRKIVCVFEDSLISKESKVSFYDIDIPEWMRRNTNMYGFDEKQFENNISMSFSWNGVDYSLVYTSDLAARGISYGRGDRSGTIEPVQVNLKLTLINNSTGHKQVILQIPSDIDLNLTGISYGDIDQDNEIDLVCTILSSACKLRFVYLSSKIPGNNNAEFIGYHSDGCIDP